MSCLPTVKAGSCEGCRQQFTVWAASLYAQWYISIFTTYRTRLFLLDWVLLFKFLLDIFTGFMWGNSVYTCVCGGTFTPDLKVRALFSDACRLFVVILTAGHASMNLQAFVRRAKCNSALMYWQLPLYCTESCCLAAVAKVFWNIHCKMQSRY